MVTSVSAGVINTQFQKKLYVPITCLSSRMAQNNCYNYFRLCTKLSTVEDTTWYVVLFVNKDINLVFESSFLEPVKRAYMAS